MTVDKISTGIPRLWLWSLPAFASGLLCGALATGFAVRLETSMTELLFSLPVLTIHTIGVALAVSHMGQQIREKNRQLDELSRTDSLTGLHVRRHWLKLADRALRQHREEGVSMTLLLLDIDHLGPTTATPFAGRRGAAPWQYDPRHRRRGRQAGCHGRRIRAGAAGDHAGPARAWVAAEAIRQAGVPPCPARLTASIGMRGATHATVEQWIDGRTSPCTGLTPAATDRRLSARRSRRRASRETGGGPARSTAAPTRQVRGQRRPCGSSSKPQTKPGRPRTHQRMAIEGARTARPRRDVCVVRIRCRRPQLDIDRVLPRGAAFQRALHQSRLVGVDAMHALRVPVSSR